MGSMTPWLFGCAVVGSVGWVLFTFGDNLFGMTLLVFATMAALGNMIGNAVHRR